MLCERCKKKTATVHMARIINGMKVETHLCDQCASEAYTENPISFQDIFQGLLNIVNNSAKPQKGETGAGEALACPSCGMTYEQFRRNGKFGCSRCYDTFGAQLDGTLKSIHGSNVHKGKIPLKSGKNYRMKKEKDELKQKLKAAIEKEEFEEAALLRDKIRALEKEA